MHEVGIAWRERLRAFSKQASLTLRLSVLACEEIHPGAAEFERREVESSRSP